MDTKKIVIALVIAIVNIGNVFGQDLITPKEFVALQKEKTSLGSNSVWCIAEDAKENLWIGTWGSGVNKFNRNKKTFERYTFLVPL